MCSSLDPAICRRKRRSAALSAARIVDGLIGPRRLGRLLAIAEFTSDWNCMLACSITAFCLLVTPLMSVSWLLKSLALSLPIPNQPATAATPAAIASARQ